jgi:CheY-like chemotaxis protein
MLDSDKLNLDKVNFLLIDDNVHSLDIIAGAISGFGGHNIVRCQSTKEAREALAHKTFDFILSDAQMPVENGYEFVRWLRREGPEQNRFAPTILVTGHTRLAQVVYARDCGAHFIVAKPITPRILLERVFWVANDERPIIECEAYVGPDRRFKRLGPPFGMDGRRKDDVKGKLGDALEPNLSQDEINAMMKPAKVML